MLDFNTAEPQRDMSLIPDGETAVVQINVRPGHAGEGGWLKRSKAGDSEMLDCEFTVVDGPYAKRKFWTMFTLGGTTEGQQKAGDISGSRIRAILESARGVKPDDQSDAAKAARQIGDWGDIDGLRFIAKIGVEKGKDGFKDKNVLEAAITPDRTAWKKVEQTLRQATAAASIGSTFGSAPPPVAQPGTIQKPGWAR
jgi:hypothetical protein